MYAVTCLPQGPQSHSLGQIERSLHHDRNLWWDFQLLSIAEKENTSLFLSNGNPI